MRRFGWVILAFLLLPFLATVRADVDTADGQAIAGAGGGGAAFNFFGHIQSNVVGASSTRSHGCYFGATGTSGGYRDKQCMITASCTLKNLCIDHGAQPASGSLVVTVKENNSATSVVVTIPASDPDGQDCDAVNTESSVAGDLIHIEIQNNATDDSATLHAWSVQCE